MNKFLTATFVALLSTAVFAQGVIPEATYVIGIGTETPPTFWVTKSGLPTPIATNNSIQAVIDAIRADAVKYTDDRFLAHIQFGNGESVLDIGGDSVQFTEGWPGIIRLSGKIKSGSSSPTIKIGRGVSISSKADIANIGGGYAIHNRGELSITGGTVSATNNAPVYHDNDFPLILSGSPSIPPNSTGVPGSLTVSIYIASGKLDVATDFNPGTEIYRIRLAYEALVAAGHVVVTNGAAYADNFLLASWSLGLVPNDDGDLVIGETTPIIKSKAASGFGIVLNGNSLQIVGISQATPVQVYDLRGNVVMSRTALPNESVSVSHLPKGVYVAKAGGMAVKVVR